MDLSDLICGGKITAVAINANEFGKLIEVTLTLETGGTITITPVGDAASLYMRVNVPNLLTVIA